VGDRFKPFELATDEETGPASEIILIDTEEVKD